MLIFVGHIEGLLLRNSKLPYTEQTVLQLAAAVKIAAKRVRFTMAAVNILGSAYPTYAAPRRRQT